MTTELTVYRITMDGVVSEHNPATMVDFRAKLQHATRAEWNEFILGFAPADYEPGAHDVAYEVGLYFKQEGEVDASTAAEQQSAIKHQLSALANILAQLSETLELERRQLQ